jgi:hypothetical protein
MLVQHLRCGLEAAGAVQAQHANPRHSTCFVPNSSTGPCDIKRCVTILFRFLKFSRFTEFHSKAKKSEEH